MGELKCQVIEITRGTTHDGPGMRTTVFLKGCPLHCPWCQNPEGMNAGQEVWWEERTCIRCLACVQACPRGAMLEDGRGQRPFAPRRDREKCALCGACVEACPSLAMSFTGREWTLSSLLREALKDRDYYQAFGGGVPVSGGAPLGQHPFVVEFFARLHEAGVHTALDTCGFAPATAFAAVLPHTDHVLFDIKILDPEMHKAHTGQSNETIMENLAAVAQRIRQARSGKAPGENRPLKLWIRTPLIPEATATRENITAISRFIRDNLLDVTERWELCAFNSACQSKYRKLGLAWTYEQVPMMGRKVVDTLQEAALSTGMTGGKLAVSGLIAGGAASEGGSR